MYASALSCPRCLRLMWASKVFTNTWIIWYDHSQLHHPILHLMHSVYELRLICLCVDEPFFLWDALTSKFPFMGFFPMFSFGIYLLFQGLTWRMEHLINRSHCFFLQPFLLLYRLVSLARFFFVRYFTTHKGTMSNHNTLYIFFLSIKHIDVHVKRSINSVSFEFGNPPPNCTWLACIPTCHDDLEPTAVVERCPSWGAWPFLPW